jgi:hypothetical protein
MMKKSRYTEEQIIWILKQHEVGVKTADLCREHGISAATLTVHEAFNLKPSNGCNVQFGLLNAHTVARDRYGIEMMSAATLVVAGMAQSGMPSASLIRCSIIVYRREPL